MIPTFPDLIQPKLAAALTKSSVSTSLRENFVATIEPVNNPRFGDYQTNAALLLANTSDMKPQELAGEIVAQFDTDGLTEIPEVAGPGFINFRISRQFLENRITALLDNGQRLGVAKRLPKQTIVIDASAPHIAKPIPASHLRSTLIVDSLSRITRFLGHDVITDIHIGDWENDFVNSPSTELARLHNRLGVRFDHYLGKRFYIDQIAPMIEEMVAKGIATENHDRSVCVQLSEHREELMIQTNDGQFPDAATELAFIDYRIKTFAPDSIWYVCSAPQQLYFNDILSVARQTNKTIDLRLIPFGDSIDKNILGTKLKTLTDEAISRTYTIIENSRPELPSSEKQTASNTIGVAVLKYAILSQARHDDYLFNWRQILSPTGNTAIFLINTHSTALSHQQANPDQPLRPIETAERALAIKIAQFAEVVPQILHDKRINLLTVYLYELASLYQPIKDSAQTALSELTANTLRLGLNLLGIELKDEFNPIILK